MRTTSGENSTKGKALQKALEHTIDAPVDIVLILDADNHMANGFLHAVNNAFEQGYQVVQGHRTAKNMETSFGLLDACTEEIGNHIFRRGHVAVGLPSALIGSGMAFDWQLFIALLKDIGETSGEDKELEFRLVRQGKKIAFLDRVYVYDEKVTKKEVFKNQRSRWLAVQIEFSKKYFVEGWVQLFKGNIAFFNKTFQTYLLPRVMLVAFFPVAPLGHVSAAVDVEAVGIGEAGGVEPVEGHAFAEMGGVEEAIDEAVVGVGAVVGEEGVDFGEGGREACEVEGEAADEGGFIGFGGGGEAFGFELGEDELVDRVSGPGGKLDDGEGGAFGGLEGPMGLVGGTLGDPIFEELFLGVGEGFIGLGRGHEERFFGGEDTGDEGAGFRLVGDDGGGA